MIKDESFRKIVIGFFFEIQYLNLNLPYRYQRSFFDVASRTPQVFLIFDSSLTRHFHIQSARLEEILNRVYYHLELSISELYHREDEIPECRHPHPEDFLVY